MVIFVVQKNKVYLQLHDSVVRQAHNKLQVLLFNFVKLEDTALM